jgi:hypothetical protein
MAYDNRTLNSEHFFTPSMSARRGRTDRVGALRRRHCVFRLSGEIRRLFAALCFLWAIPRGDR